jgi:DNA-binding beta-propeller fold protein YncE
MLITRVLLVLLLSLPTAAASAEVRVTTVDLLVDQGLTVNGAGPLLVMTDVDRNRVIAPCTLSSSISIIDGATHAVTNIPLETRAIQHLKAEAMTLRRATGEIYLLGPKQFHIVDPDKATAISVKTGAQFESIAVDEKTGNVFLAGRECRSLGFYEAGKGTFRLVDWTDHEEPLVNLNQTPPPPIRKVVADAGQGRILAVDGFAATLQQFDAATAEKLQSRELPLTAGGRWHLAGYNPGTRRLYLVTETAERKVSQAAALGLEGHDQVVKLPDFTEGVGITYNPVRDEVYIPYDNHPAVHVVTFGEEPALFEIALPAFGNDSAVIDLERHLLYVGSWSRGEIDVVDLEARRLKKRITGMGIIPHMFSMTFNPNNGLLYFPRGATAVNGAFGAALATLEPDMETLGKVYTGRAPVDLIELPGRRSVLVFDSEDSFAEVQADGSFQKHRLPYDFPVRAVRSPEGDVYLSYGPHQSYWPTVYIWAARNGVLTIDAESLEFYDRRIHRQAHEMALDHKGVLYYTQNNWGAEEQFLGTLRDQVRLIEVDRRLPLGDTVEREITQRILRFDPQSGRLYLVRTAENDDDPSILQVIDPEAPKPEPVEGEGQPAGHSPYVEHRLELGVTATSLVHDEQSIYVANFDSDSVAVIAKEGFVRGADIPTGDGPLKLALCDGRTFVLNHLGRSLQEVTAGGTSWPWPFAGTPDGLFAWNSKLVVTGHGAQAMSIALFDPADGTFTEVRRLEYPFGETRFDSANVSFYLRGQYGDALFDLCRSITDQKGRLWVTDFLSGKVFIVEE